MQGQKNIALSYNCRYNNKQSTILLLHHKTKYNSDFIVLKQWFKWHKMKIYCYHIMVGIITNKLQNCCYIFEQNTTVIYILLNELLKENEYIS